MLCVCVCIVAAVKKTTNKTKNFSYSMLLVEYCMLLHRHTLIKRLASRFSPMHCTQLNVCVFVVIGSLKVNSVLTSIRHCMAVIRILTKEHSGCALCNKSKPLRHRQQQRCTQNACNQRAYALTNCTQEIENLSICTLHFVHTCTNNSHSKRVYFSVKTNRQLKMYKRKMHSE